LVWGSTYLAIRITLLEGSGLSPFNTALMRAFTGGILLLIWGIVKKQHIKPTRHELVTLFVSGLLLWAGGNGLVMWAEQYADSSLAALTVASMPIWMAIIDSIVDRKPPSWMLAISLLIGFSGTGLLAVPSLRSGVQTDLFSVIALFGATILWSLGSIFQARRPINLSPRVSAAYQMFSGCLGFLILTLVTGEPFPAPTTQAWLAWAYLVIFGSTLAFTAYVSVLKQLPLNIVSTYAYVNPVIAVLLGWLILQEEITPWTIGGSVLILLGVTGVFREKYGKKKSEG
jgi:drug/metabolite transporter (DMT)-like permease